MPTVGSPLLAGGGILGRPPRASRAGSPSPPPQAVPPEDVDAFGRRKHSLLEPQSGVLRTGEGHCRSVGPRQRDVWIDFWSHVPGRRADQAAADCRTAWSKSTSRSLASPSLEMFLIGARSDAQPESDERGHMRFSPIIPRTDARPCSRRRGYSAKLLESSMSQSA